MKTFVKTSMRLLAVLFIGALMLSSCKKEPEPIVEDPFGILTFSLTMPNGQTIQCAVDQDAKTIINTADPVEPGLPASQYVMKINYTATLETTVKMGDEAVVSGETTADFSSPVTIVAVKGDKEVSYTVTVIEDANDASQTSGKRVNSDMTGSGFPQCAWFDIAMFNGEFYAITSSYPEGTAEENPAYYDVYKSADGIAWTKVETSIPTTGAFGARLVVFNNKLWAYGGGRFYGTDEDGTAPESMWGMFPDISQLFLSSTADGQNWTTETVIDEGSVFNGYVDARLFEKDGKLVYMGGLTCVFGQIQKAYNVATSPDGITWTGVESIDKTSGAAMYGCGALYNFKGKTFIAGGFKNFVSPGPDYAQKSVFSTADGGLTWTEETTDGGFGAMWNMRVVSAGDVLYMVGGELYGEGAPDEEGNPTEALVVSNKIYRSTDGVNWTALEGENAMPETFVGRSRPCLVVDGDMLWIFGGRGNCSGYYGGPSATDEMIFDTWKKKIK